MGTTEKIANFIVETGYQQIPEEAVTMAKNAFLDGFGVALAGSHEPSAKILTEYTREIGGNPQASVIGSDFKTSAPQAALVNGTIAHALDYDDCDYSWIGHPTAALLPAVLALGEMFNICGKEALEAYILGFEAEAKIGVGIGFDHYMAGWHSTATIGTMGATAAAAKVLKLSPKETRMALGIAASQASGLRQNFGTMTKPFHAGNAAKNGVVAGLLAKKGFTADENILENPFGFGKLFAAGGRYDVAKMSQGLGNPFSIISPGLSMKPYPSCRETHRCLDAALCLIKEHHISAEDVAQVECKTNSMAPQILIHSQPRTALEGKFSMQYCMAIALLDGEVGIKQFTDEKVSHPKAQELIKRVKYAYAESTGGIEALLLPETVTIKLKDGREYSHEVKVPKGGPQNPMSAEELASKYRECARSVLSEEDMEHSLELISHLEDVEDITELINLVSPERPPKNQSFYTQTCGLHLKST